MKLLFTGFILGALQCLVGAQTGQQIEQYSYHVWGMVLIEEFRPMSNLNVCVVPAEGPILTIGRMPCVKANYAGEFALTVRDFPGKYMVCATATNSSFKILTDKRPSLSVTCSPHIEFPSNDDSREVNLKLQRRTDNSHQPTKPNKSLDRSGGCVSCIIIDPARLE